MSNKKIPPPPADGGSYRHKGNGEYERLDTPQAPDPGKTARRAAAAAKAKPASKSEAKPAGDNVRSLRKEKE